VRLRLLLSRLEAAGCEPRKIGPGQWIAICPTRKLNGWHSLIEIREPGIVCCTNAHEAPERQRAVTAEAREAA
jgi:hypothetical protein